MEEGSSWQYQAPRANVHPRDEDYYGEGKRRKYNNGVGLTYLPFTLCYLIVKHWQNYESSYDKGYDDGAHDGGHARQVDYAQDYPTDDRYQRGGGHSKKRLIPSEPSPHVIFLGLDPDFTEADVREILPSVS